MNPIANKWSWGLQKTSHIVCSLFLRNAPEFVYARSALTLEGQIPVFTFHSASPSVFRRQCEYLAINGYRTLSSDELLYALQHPGHRARKSIVITFDDGLKTVWSVAYPILKKYGFKAVCFLIPGCIPSAGSSRPTLDDVERGKAQWNEVADPGVGTAALMNWAEIRALHDSGIVDFQSHTLYHHLVPVSDRIFDFFNPEYDTHFYGNIHIPVYTDAGKDLFARNPLFGMPIYHAQPRMQAHRRYFEDEAVRHLCVQYVSEHGGREFFQQRTWRRHLSRLVSDYCANRARKGRYETSDERDREVMEDLRRSKEMIEWKLPGKNVTHLCYPWYEAARFAIDASRAVGFQANYFGTVWGKATNRPGDDPFRIVRLEGYFLERLPGEGRLSSADIVRSFYGGKWISAPTLDLN